MIVMDEKTLNGIWNYFLMLESDLDNTSRYIEPQEQESVYSFEFAKLLILACTEVESVFKSICFEIKQAQVPGDIAEYKATILGKYPKIVNATVKVKRLGRSIEPFSGWDNGPLLWWSAYNAVKHNRGSNFSDATYINATTAIAALYVLILYLAELTGIQFNGHESKYIDSDYVLGGILFGPFKKLPDFEESK